MENTIIQVTAQDRMNYLLGLFSANQIISIVLDFPERLNVEILERAFQITLEIYPVLGCRFVEAEEPRWKKVNNPNGHFFMYENCTKNNTETEIKEFIIQPREYMPLQIQSKLFRDQTDKLCVKISHLCSDAVGLKEYITTLSSIYTDLSRSNGNKDVEIEILAKNITGFRDQAPLFSTLKVADPRSLLKENNASPMWAFPSSVDKNDTPNFLIRRLPPHQMNLLRKRCKELSVTINDVLITAYLRAMEKHAIPADEKNNERMVGITVDLRRYLPDQTTGTICNLSGMEMPTIEMVANEEFETTLKKVRKSMETLKSSQPGLSSAAGMELLSKMPLSAVKGIYNQQHEIAIKTKMALPLLTNMGVVNHGAIQFDNIEASDGYMITPIMYSPFFCVGASTYKDILTLSVGFHTPAVSIKNVNQLLDDMLDEMI